MKNYKQLAFVGAFLVTVSSSLAPTAHAAEPTRVVISAQNEFIDCMVGAYVSLAARVNSAKQHKVSIEKHCEGSEQKFWNAVHENVPNLASNFKKRNANAAVKDTKNLTYKALSLR